MKSEAPARWRRVKIGEIAEVVGGGTPKTSDDGNFEGIIPWITPKDLSSHQGRYIERGERSISEKGLTSSSARLLPANAVLVSTRAPIGYCAIAKVPLATNQGFRSLVIKDGHSPEFFYYLVKANTPTLEAHASGSTFKELSGGTFKEIEFAIPPIEEQRRIAWVLGSLDDKIELNRRIAKTLEQIAATIFKARFVDFVGVEEFEESELGPIPKGWSVLPLGRIATAEKVTFDPQSDPDQTLEHFSIPAYDAGGVPEIVRGGDLKSSKLRVGAEHVLVSRLNPSRRRVWWPRPEEPTAVAVCSPEFSVLKPHEGVTHPVLFSYMRFDSRIWSYMVNHATGTTGSRQRIKPAALMEAPLVIPPLNEMTAISRIVSPILEREAHLQTENRRLAAIRDALLPKLISGQIRVPEGCGPDDAAEVADDLVESESQKQAAETGASAA